MDSVYEVLRLSLVVLPLFIEASREQAKRCRQKPKLQAFYTRVESTLVTSDNVLTNLHTRSLCVPLPEIAQHEIVLLLSKLLRLLERTANTPADTGRADLYPKLQNLRKPRFQALNDPCGLRRFQSRAGSENVKKFQSALDKILLRLINFIHTDQAMQSYLRDPVASTEQNNSMTGVETSDPSADIAEILLIDESEPKLLHQAIAERWVCQCPSRHKAKLKLISCCCVDPSGRGTKFDMMLSARFEQSQWQRAYIKLSGQEGKAVQFASNPMSASPATVPPKKNTFSIRTKAQPEISIDEQIDEFKGMKATHGKSTSIGSIGSLAGLGSLKKMKKPNSASVNKFSLKSSLKSFSHKGKNSVDQKSVGYSEAAEAKVTQQVIQASISTARESLNSAHRAVPEVLSGIAQLTEIAQGGICQLLHSNPRRSIISFLASKTSQGLSLRGGFEGRQFLDHVEVLPLSSVLGPAQDDSTHTHKLMDTSLQSKLILANVLANAVMQLYGSPWTSRKWNKDRLSFAIAGSRYNSLNAFVELYLSSELDEQQTQGLTSSLQSLHPHPRLLDLGIMLLEIELRSPIENERQLADLGPNRQMLDCTDLSVADRLLKSERLSATLSDYRSAIQACINAQECAGKDVYFVRQWIKRRIVKPLSALLWHCFKMSVTADGIYQEGRLLSDVRNSDTYIAIPSMEIDSEDVQIDSVERGRFLDCEKHAAFDQSEQSHSSDWWFEQLETITIPHLNNLRLQQSSLTTPNIRIAILDTGIDVKRVRTPRGEKILPFHPVLKAHAGRIKDFGVWNAGMLDATRTEMTDHHGHGTHAAALILKVAPYAELYVAQVDRGKDIFEPDALSVADAIRHATEVWNVDIVTMSFGFQVLDPRIYEAIRHAHNHENKVIMFAAASNGGMIFGETFPATCEEVISIRSADGYGKPSKFNPNVSEDSMYSQFYKVIGENVLSAWPSHLDQAMQKRQTGSSIAAPIAAAVVALLLEYVKVRFAIEHVQQGWAGRDFNELWRRIRYRNSAFGIRTVLKLMSEKDKDSSLRFIMPWLLMSDHGSARWEMLKAL